jgi:hypothetical protein
MGQKFVNNLVLELAASIDSSQSTITVVSSAGLPILGVGDWVYLTITDIREGGELRWEIVRVNNYSGNSLSTVRGQDGTTGQSWAAGAKLGNRVVAQDLNQLTAFKDSKGTLNGVAPLVNGTVPTSNLPNYINTAVQTVLDNKTPTNVSSVNASHTLRQEGWVHNFDGTVTGALAIKITGLYTRTMSGGISLLVTQNNTTEGIYPDWDIYISGNWRSADTTWHNTEARALTVSNIDLNVRFAHDSSDCYMVIGNTNSVWNFPRLVIKDAVTNTVAAGYVPGFEVSVITSLPSSVDSTVTVSGVGTMTMFNTALTAALA